MPALPFGVPGPQRAPWGGCHPARPCGSRAGYGRVQEALHHLLLPSFSRAKASNSTLTIRQLCCFRSQNNICVSSILDSQSYLGQNWHSQCTARLSRYITGLGALGGKSSSQVNSTVYYQSAQMLPGDWMQYFVPLAFYYFSIRFYF